MPNDARNVSACMPIGSAADFGSTVRALRKQRGWTQRQLADLCGCSIMYVSNLERGKETAELGLALRILNRLSYDPHGDRPARPHRGAAMSVLEDCVPGETPAPAPAPSVPAAPPADPRAAADAAFMRLALEQAALAAEVDEVPIGAVVVYEGRVIAAAHNRRELDEDPSAHAEFSAMVAAARALGHWRLTGCTVYVTLEPCLMCAGLMVNGRVDRCVYGAPDPKGGALGTLYDVSHDARLNHAFEVTAGVLQDECAEQLRAFFRRRRREAKAARAAAAAVAAEG